MKDKRERAGDGEREMGVLCFVCACVFVSQVGSKIGRPNKEENMGNEGKKK